MTKTQAPLQAHTLSIGECAGGEACAAELAGLPKRASLRLTLEEEVALEVVRLILSTYLTADARYWDGAVAFAETNLGAGRSAQVVTQATVFVRALRHDRQAPFNFLTFGCQHISDDERDMVAAWQAAAIGPQCEFIETMTQLAQSEPPPRLSAAVRALSDVIQLRQAEAPSQQAAFERVRISRNEALH